MAHLLIKNSNLKPVWCIWKLIQNKTKQCGCTIVERDKDREVWGAEGDESEREKGERMILEK